MIVDKIQKYLISEGMDVPEAILNEVCALAKMAFSKQFGKREDRGPKTHPYFSSIGKCLRQQAYDLLGFPSAGRTIDARAKMVFFQGDMAELAMVQLAKVAGCEITACGKDQERLEYKGMVGRPDGVLWDGGEGYLLEAKSMSSYGFKDFERGVIDPGYIYQINSGMEALHLKKSVVLALNKDAGVMAEKIVSRDPTIVTDIDARIKTLDAVTKETLPDRPYQPNEKGFYPWQCLYCQFHVTCLPDAEKVLVGKAYKLKSKEIKNVSTAKT